MTPTHTKDFFDDPDIGPVLPPGEPLWSHGFDTALGRCGVVWSGQGIVASLLPEATPARLRRRHPTAREVAELPPAIARVVEGIRALLAGEAHDLSDVVLDERGIPEFRRQVHALTRAIPPGQTRTYGEIAAALGQPGAARAVGRAEGENPFPPIVPCHRVMGAGGEPTGFSAPGGIETKRRMLLIEARAAGQLAGDQQALF
ncbi:methylated-DNA--[protein]-cysteine S-methyltransferase [Roseateles saccharophilus]|uniref:Methylated-DNA-[protein]-cysteine S-methyltransferase n=1 Tax=Roseateles saccharophilus TaxID=304 RepID=A0A4R3VAS5_ROSSA|nr:methylated-DNA--[protein]-cysteine S-methyltransferase [Roseateles saccharophilus]MDG0832288.1 methylated-DNA--[protein]-cysteine S-methyltransferase [Roseateles saccharophilus]TCV02337.1 methylated-DNA-[protein]-cysteine S-methyltransferase [Roseateles saccharophilus]